MDTLINAGSWQVAVELTRAMPDLQVFETHPGGGQYDCLTLVGERAKLDINRAGSIHAHTSPTGEHIPLVAAEEWQPMLTHPGGAAAVAELAASRCGLPRAKRRPPTSARLLQYRLIARLLASRMFASTRWDVRSRFHDSSGPEGSCVVGTAPGADVEALTPQEVWRVLRGGVEVAWLWDGWAWTSDGERRDLMSAYRRGASVDHLVATITARPGREHATQLPTRGGAARHESDGAP